MRIMLFFLAYYVMFQFFSYLPIMLSDFPIMLHSFTYYAQISAKNALFKRRNTLIDAGALQMVV